MKVWRMHHSFYKFDLPFSIPPPLFLDLITVGLCRHGDYQLLDFEHQMVNRYQVTFYHTSTFLVISEENTTEKMFQFLNSLDNHKFPWQSQVPQPSTPCFFYCNRIIVPVNNNSITMYSAHKKSWDSQA